jgi:hypothetical protein
MLPEGTQARLTTGWVTSWPVFGSGTGGSLFAHATASATAVIGTMRLTIISTSVNALTGAGQYGDAPRLRNAG